MKRKFETNIPSNDYRKWMAQKEYTKGRKDKLGNEIEFKLTPEEWLSWWQATGHYHERGSRKGQYVMARINDIGHYELGNIKCLSSSDNVRDGSTGRTDARGRKATQATKDKMSETRIGIKKPLVNCPHCGKAGGAGVMGRWHFDKCKLKGKK